jgi:secondary thiamine-phosphate synthase enzyme
MKFELEIHSKCRVEFVDVTEALQDCIRQSQVQDGICVVFAPHTSAGLTCNENWDPAVQADALMVLDRMAPLSMPGYTHSEGNSAAHVKASLLGNSQTLVVEAGKLLLGTWQGVYLAEFDGPRRRRLIVRVLRDGDQA